MALNTAKTGFSQLGRHLYRYEDTCNVYALRSGDSAVLIDFGSGGIVPELAREGVTEISDVLMTHHHRDQGQGLGDLTGFRKPVRSVWVPHTEQDLFHSVEEHWQSRPVMNDYNMRQDRFSLLRSTPVAGTLKDYATLEFEGYSFTVWPTPGHTTGSISLLTTVDGQRLAFTGDLIYGPGQVWSLAATQWSYNGAEGVAASILSLLSLKEQEPDVLLPSHGDPINDVDEAIDLLVERLWELLRERRQNPRLFELRQKPFEALLPHLLFNRTCMAYSYVLLSQSGKALFFDFGYDFFVGGAAGSDRASRRPWLYNIEALKEQFGVTEIEAVVLTHFHDDHVAGVNLLRDVEGAEVWAAESFASILEKPRHYDLPCLWYDAIAVDRTLALEETLRWEEYEMTLHALPGHTRYAVAISLEVDGHTVLVSGDQYEGEGGLLWNYVYHNGFEVDDYVESAKLYRETAPDLILTGHWQPLWPQDGYFEKLEQGGDTLARLHRQLLPAETLDAGAEGFVARIEPYQQQVMAGEAFELCVEVRNPLPQKADVEVTLMTPPDWQVEPAFFEFKAQAGQVQSVCFSLTAPTGRSLRRVPIGADVTIGGRRWGQQAEALVSLTDDGRRTADGGSQAPDDRQLSGI
ncbi:MAG: MBL fold metallo-hydrolase [Chloroflexota bacterium]